MRRKITFVVALALVAAAALLFHRCQGRSSEAGPRQAGRPDDAGQRAGKPPTGGASLSQVDVAQGRPDHVAQRLGQTFAQLTVLASASDAESARRILDETARDLLELPARTVATVILEELDSGRDADTGLPFRPGEDGLESWPTWRVYLLDLLGSIHPKMAADYARREVFAGYASSDEWAVAMRSVWAAAPHDRQAQTQGELSDLLQRMLGYEAWRAQPSDGMLEAMDFVPLAAEPSRHLAVLHEWAAGAGDGRVDTAVQIAAERAVLRQGDLILSALASDPGLWATAPAHRASIMARADLRQPAQAAAVRAYLGQLQPGSSEAEAFFGLFPNHRFSVIPGLAGWPPVPAAGEMHAADAAAWEMMAAWGNEAALAAHAGSLASLREKLGRMLQGP